MYKIIGADKQEYGPIDLATLKQWIAEGRVNCSTLLQTEGTPDWRPALTFPEVAALLPQVIPSAFPPPVGGFASGALPQRNTMALAGMILGIVSVPLVCCCYGLPWNVLGLTFSIIGLSQIKRDPSQTGKNMALAGLILSIVSLLLGLALLAFFISIGPEEIMKEFKRLRI